MSIFLTEFRPVVMSQTYEIIQRHAQRLELTVGEVIDRAFADVTSDDTDVMAQYAYEQFLIGLGSLDAERAADVHLHMAAELCHPFLVAGVEPMALMDWILEKIAGKDDN